MSTDLKPGDVVIYCRVENDPAKHVEIGVVKSLRERGAFVAYHLGDTVAMTPYANLTKVHNGYAIGGLAERRKQLTGRLDPLCEGYEDWSEL